MSCLFTGTKCDGCDVWFETTGNCLGLVLDHAVVKSQLATGRIPTKLRLIEQAYHENEPTVLLYLDASNLCSMLLTVQCMARLHKDCADWAALPSVTNRQRNLSIRTCRQGTKPSSVLRR